MARRLSRRARSVRGPLHGEPPSRVARERRRQRIRSREAGVRVIVSRTPAFLFDLDGTLVDSVYQHVLAWREALEAAGIELAVWRIHRRIGMSGGLFVNALAREMGRSLTAEEVASLQAVHAEAYERQREHLRPLPGA